MNLEVERRKHVVRAIFEEGWNQERFGSFAEQIGEDVIFNFRGERQATNIEGLKSLITFWRQAFPDLQFEVLHLLAEADLVAVNLVFKGTHEGEWQGIAPTGRSFEIEEMMFFRFQGDTLVELWEVYDEALLIRKLTEKD